MIVSQATHEMQLENLNLKRNKYLTGKFRPLKYSCHWRINAIFSLSWIQPCFFYKSFSWPLLVSSPHRVVSPFCLYLFLTLKWIWLRQFIVKEIFYRLLY